MPTRLVITKTPKCYVGGAFIRSESGRVTALRSADGAFFANVPRCSRKDLRNAVEAAAKAGPGWAGRSAFNRGQILYRLAEMMEARADELTAALTRFLPPGKSAAESAAREVRSAIDRTIHYSGWTDKYGQLLGSVNPVSSSHFNFTVTEPVGITAVIAPDAAPLLGLLSLVLPAITTGNTTVALASAANPYPSILLGEMLAVSDLPGGVVNLLTGDRAELLPTFATHEHIRVITGVGNPEEIKSLQLGAAESVKRTRLLEEKTTTDWTGDGMQGLEWLRATVEFKTTWHPIGS
jgi:acyl-CoA reductase-like NAD-dependent aldehyde dehydrogenase